MEKNKHYEAGNFSEMRKAVRQIRRALRWLRTSAVRGKRWWLRNDRRYGLKWRVGNALAAFLLLFTVALPVVQLLTTGRAYALSADTQKLIGVPDPALSKQLTYDGATRTYYFNKSAIKGNDTNPAMAMQAQIGRASGQDSDKSLYALDVPQNITQGVTYHDINSGLSFSLKPEFGAGEGRQVDGHLVFPLGGGKQAIYTLKNAGLKEDIVVQKVKSDTMTFAYQLDLPKALAAKVIPDSGGAIGIYSGDPALYGNISYATDADRLNVEKARENAEKTYLVFRLPTPVIKNTAGSSVGTGRFELHGSQLSVIASGLKGQKGPITIDPSVVVTSSADFLAGNDGNNTDYGTANQLTRGGLTGGVPATTTWSNGPNLLNNTRTTPGMVAYNGFMYVYGGYDGPSLSDVQYATINSSTGALGSWTSTTAMPVARAAFGYFAYNGYLYALGGTTDGFTTASNEVWYAPINSNGTVGTWKQTTGFATARINFNAAVYNGYAYIMGGDSIGASSEYNDVQYAPINADGTFGAWKTTSSFTNGRAIGGGLIYNGYIYIVGGYDNSSLYNDVQYAPIKSDGSVGTWAATSSFTNGRSDFRAIAYNGYMYLMGGYRSGAQTDFQYAPINANGTVGAWRTTSAPLTPALYQYGSTAYNGYLYLAGGNDNTGSDQVLTRYIKIDGAGQLTSWSADTHSVTARADTCVASNNQYLYAIGGSTSDDDNNNVQTISYVPVGSNGATTTTWTETSSGTGALPATRGEAGCAISQNNILYVIGGHTGSPTGTLDGAALYASLNLSTGAVGTFTSSAHTITNDINSNYKPIGSGVFVYNNFLYSVGGGFSSGSSVASAQGVFYAPLDPSTGAIGTWVQANSLSQNYFARAFARVGNHLYAIGGRDGTPTNQAGVESATINSNGSLSTWTTTNMTALPVAVAFSHATTVNGCIYAVGGETSGGTSLSSVYFNCPASDGTLRNAWKTAPSLPTATTDMGVTSNGGFVYGVGGFTTTITGALVAAPVNNGSSGQVGGWTVIGDNESSVMPTTMEAFGSVAYNGYAYMAGGRDNSGNDRNTVHYATINSNGSLGTFASGGTLASSGVNAPVRQGSVMLASNGYLYVIGGNNFGFSTYYPEVYYAAIGANGTPGTWNTTSALPSGRTPGCGATYNGYLYVMGGFRTGNGNITDVLYAQPGASGILNGGGSWSVATSLSNSVGYCFAANGYMYAIGDTSVVSAPINANGSLGSWSSVASPPNSQGGVGGVAAGASFGVLDGFVYFIGGCTDSNGDCTSSATSAAQFAPIETGGALGTWQTSTALPNAIGAGGGFAYNGYIYQFGGYNGGATYSNILNYAPLSVIDRTGSYTKLVDLGSANNLTGVSYNGTLPFGSSVTYKAAPADGVFGSSTATTTASGAGGCVGTQTNTRYLQLYVTLSDATTSFFPDASPSDPASDFPAQLNDVTVNYNYFKPPPNVRLRGGQTLQTGNLTAFDTCLSSITHLQSAIFTASSTTATTSVAITLPSVGAGHLLVTTIDWGLSTGTPACSDTLGSSWTTLVIGHDATNTKSVAVCYAATTGSGANTITAGSLGSTTVKSIAVDEYSGVLINAGTAQLDGSATSSVTTGTTGASNSITTTVAGDLIFGAVGITNTAAPVISASGSFTLRASNGANSAPRAANEDFVQSAAGSTNASWSFNGTSSTYLSGVIAFKAAPRQ